MLGFGWFPDQLGGLDRYYRSLLEHLPEAHGVVIGADASCIPEIIGKAGFLVNADSPEQVARAILDLGGRPVRSKCIEEGLLRASQFSWNSSASKHMDVYTSIAASV